MLKVLYLLNFAGKAGTERYVETLVKYLAADGLVQPFFAYNEGGLLVERMCGKRMILFLKCSIFVL